MPWASPPTASRPWAWWTRSSASPWAAHTATTSRWQMAAFLKRALGDAFRQVADLKAKDLLDRRYERLQSYGRFSDTKAESR